MLFSIAAGKSRLHDTGTFRPVKVSHSIYSSSCLFLVSYPVNDHADCCNDCQNRHNFPCPLFHVPASFPLFMLFSMFCPVNDCTDNGCRCNCNNPYCCFHCFPLHSHFLPFLFFLLVFFFPLFFLSVFFPASSSMRISRIVSSPSVDT